MAQARRYEEPRCVAPDETGRPCGVRMQALGERDPSFGPNWRPGCWIFRCKRCGAMRAIEREKLGRYVSPIS